jgi:uncharacterized membrane protein
MFEFDQYLGFLAFATILTIGFWLMIFLLTFVIPYWVGGALLERLKEIRDSKRVILRNNNKLSTFSLFKFYSNTNN